MRREPLLIETLLTKQITRPGPVYIYRQAQGPPPSHNQKLDRFFNTAAQKYDLSPLLSGDQQQARQVAQDYIKYLKKEAVRSKLPFDLVRKRMKKISPHLRRSLLTFFTYLDAQVKTAT